MKLRTIGQSGCHMYLRCTIWNRKVCHDSVLACSVTEIWLISDSQTLFLNVVLFRLIFIERGFTKYKNSKCVHMCVTTIMLDNMPIFLYFLLIFNPECENTAFGVNCSQSCYCADDKACNNVNGSCPLGRCAPGWMGDTCSDKC